MKGPTPLPIDVRFWHMVGPADLNGCRRWLGYVNPQTGYGQMSMGQADAERFGARTVTAPVVACTLAHGPRPDGAMVLHSCDVRACCAPEHVRWGTAAENNAEAWERGRQASGEQHHQARLTDAEVAEVLRRARSGERVRALADEYGVGFGTIYDWLRGEGRGSSAVA